MENRFPDGSAQSGARRGAPGCNVATLLGHDSEWGSVVHSPSSDEGVGNPTCLECGQRSVGRVRDLVPVLSQPLVGQEQLLDLEPVFGTENAVVEVGTELIEAVAYTSVGWVCHEKMTTNGHEVHEVRDRGADVEYVLERASIDDGGVHPPHRRV